MPAFFIPIGRQCLLFGWLFLLFTTTEQGLADQKPSVVQGQIDLSEWSSNELPQRLEGPWRFFWQELIEPKEIAARYEQTSQAHFVALPGYWVDSPQPDGKGNLPSEGVGTYVLKIAAPKIINVDAGLLPWAFIAEASRIYLVAADSSGVALVDRSLGRVSADPQQLIPAYDSPIIRLPFEASRSYYLVVQLASFNSRSGGMSGAPFFGSLEKLEAYKNFNGQKLFFLLGLLGLLALFNFSLFAQRHEDRASLILGCYALVQVARNMGTEYVWFQLFTDDSNAVAWSIISSKITYCVSSLSGPVFVSFVRASFPGQITRFMHRLAWGLAIPTLIYTLLAPTKLMSSTAGLLTPIGLVAYIIIAIGLLRAVALRIDCAKLSLFGFLISNLAFLSDVFVGIGLYHAPYFAQYGLIVLIFIQSQIVGIRFARAFRAEKKLNEGLKEQERIRTQFFHNTSHELRTPINGILGFVKIMIGGGYGDLSDKMTSQLGKVCNLAEGLLGQINTILDLAKYRHGELKLNHSMISLEEIFQETSILAEGLLIKSANRHFEATKSWTDQESPSFINDREKVLTLLRNLLGNAFKFLKPNVAGTVRLSLSLSAEGSLIIQVADDGIGIAAEDQKAIFDEFKQLEGNSRRAHEGTGLGLAMVKNLVNLMQGSIELESKVAVGSTFTLTIPAGLHVDGVHRMDRQYKDQHQLVPAAEHDQVNQPLERRDGDLKFTGESRALNKNSYRVLIVDDNHINCEVLIDILGAFGYGTFVAYGGEDALLQMRSQKPDLLLLDLMMPGYSGEDVLKAMKIDPLLADIPVILLTARASNEDRLIGLNLGADDYLAKPIVIDEMLLRVRNTLARIDYARAVAQKSMLESSLAAAQEVHTSLGEVAEQIPDVEVVDYYQAAEMTGGDWFGLNYDSSSQRLYILIGDVTGHGMTSALITVAAAGAVKGAIKTLKHLGGSLSMSESLGILSLAVNESVLDAGRKVERAMTMAFIVIDLSSGKGCYLNAGHNPIMIIGRQDTHSLVAGGTPLGIDKDPDYPTKDFSLESGESLFLYTDGLIENRGPDEHTFKQRQLKKALAFDSELEKIKVKILDEARLIWKDREADDDCSFLMVKWRKSGDSAAKIA